MPKPLPIEFRRKVVDTYNAGDGTIEEIAKRFCISFNSVIRWLHLDQFTDDISPKRYKGGPAPKISDESLPLLRALVEEKPDRTCVELAEIWSARFQCEVRRTTIAVALERANISLKKRRFELPNATSKRTLKSAEFLQQN